MSAWPIRRYTLSDEPTCRYRMSGQISSGRRIGQTSTKYSLDSLPFYLAGRKYRFNQLSVVDSACRHEIPVLYFAVKRRQSSRRQIFTCPSAHEHRLLGKTAHRQRLLRRPACRLYSLVGELPLSSSQAEQIAGGGPWFAKIYCLVCQLPDVDFLTAQLAPRNSIAELIAVMDFLASHIGQLTDIHCRMNQLVDIEHLVNS